MRSIQRKGNAKMTDRTSDTSSTGTIGDSRLVQAKGIAASTEIRTVTVTQPVRTAATRHNKGVVKMRFVPQDPGIETQDTSI